MVSPPPPPPICTQTIHRYVSYSCMVVWCLPHTHTQNMHTNYPQVSELFSHGVFSNHGPHLWEEREVTHQILDGLFQFLLGQFDAFLLAHDGDELLVWVSTGWEDNASPCALSHLNTPQMHVTGMAGKIMRAPVLSHLNTPQTHVTGMVGWIMQALVLSCTSTHHRNGWLDHANPYAPPPPPIHVTGMAGWIMQASVLSYTWTHLKYTLQKWLGSHSPPCPLAPEHTSNTHHRNGLEGDATPCALEGEGWGTDSVLKLLHSIAVFPSEHCGSPSICNCTLTNAFHKKECVS